MDPKIKKITKLKTTKLKNLFQRKNAEREKDDETAREELANLGYSFSASNVKHELLKLYKTEAIPEKPRVVNKYNAFSVLKSSELALAASGNYK